jgi:hypothetical protein
MKIIIQFVEAVSKEKMLHNLRNVKKIIPSLRSYPFEITDEKYLVKNDEGKVFVEWRYFVDEKTHVISFDKFKGELKDEVEEMLIFDFPEEMGEKCFVFNQEKKWKMYFSINEWFLIEKNKVFKIGADREKLMEMEKYRIPLETRK